MIGFLTLLFLAWQAWGAWGTCSNQCGEGMQRRNRTCLNGLPGVVGCEGHATAAQECQGTNCLGNEFTYNFSFVNC